MASVFEIWVDGLWMRDLNTSGLGGFLWGYCLFFVRFLEEFLDAFYGFAHPRTLLQTPNSRILYTRTDRKKNMQRQAPSVLDIACRLNPKT